MRITVHSLARPIVSAALTLALVTAFIAFGTAGSAAHAAPSHVSGVAPAASPNAPDGWYTSWA